MSGAAMFAHENCAIARSPSSNNAGQTGIRPALRPCTLADACSPHDRAKPATGPSLLPWWSCPWRRSLPVRRAWPGYRNQHDPGYHDEPYRLSAPAPIAASVDSWLSLLRVPEWSREATSLHTRSKAVSSIIRPKLQRVGRNSEAYCASRAVLVNAGIRRADDASLIRPCGRLAAVITPQPDR